MGPWDHGTMGQWDIRTPTMMTPHFRRYALSVLSVVASAVKTFTHPASLVGESHVDSARDSRYNLADSNKRCARMIKRRKSRKIRLGNIEIGGDAPVSVQSMTTTRTEDVAATVAQIRELEAVGCEIVRVAVPTDAAASALGEIKNAIGIPLVADVHFSHALALEAVRQGVDGLRINPGNMRNMNAVRQVVLAAGERGTPIRIGVNSGSIVERRGLDVLPGPADICSLMVDTALEYCDFFESLGFADIKLSVKASDVPTTMERTPRSSLSSRRIPSKNVVSMCM